MSLQFLVDGLVAGAVIGLGAIGVTLTYAILRFANFAHGEFISWGAYLALLASGLIGAAVGGPRHRSPPSPSPDRSSAAGSSPCWRPACWRWRWIAVLFRRLRRSDEGIVAVMASFGASLALRSLIEAIFSSRPAYFTRALQIAKPIGFGARSRRTRPRPSSPRRCWSWACISC